jgi:ubiquinol-cytochrome c reductase cytochrome c subunit
MRASSSCLCVFVVACVLSGVVRAVQPNRGDADRGRQTYVKVGCYQCHGREAQGASTGPRLGPDPMPLAQFTRYVRAPRNEMPPYTAKVLSDAELADIHAFVAARARPRLP